MPFGHDTEDGLLSVAALVNTATPDDTLTEVADLDAFVESWGYTGTHERTHAELDEVRALRPRFLEAWSLSRDELVAFVNEVMLQYRALPQLVRHDEWDYHLHATPSDAPLASRMAVDAVMAFVDVIRADELDRLKMCAGDCGGVLVDLSKNRSRRYCDRGCGNRANVAAYRARKAAESVS
ncbi:MULTISPECIES: CGNR zinc finger domain-containing protein [Dermacoccus]|uniref:CGNR zinc finger domain-containing protein n=1 Tax=Dermacoccus TaxID=57495 RepID=UPI00093C4BEC|nr:MULTISPECIES: CGNR zinc finger domain-containing protein [Dermacoccus]MBO1756997.1 CGNR zinc finger domain-containing protein [Dermacoccus sp. NHGro5]MCG7428859.1 CGNR zinc finger domain-containing protein [Dermacoccus nishinomiyaensis]